MLVKKPHATDLRKAGYGLMKKRLAFMLILREVASGRAQHDPQTVDPLIWFALVNADKATLISGLAKPCCAAAQFLWVPIGLFAPSAWQMHK